MAAVNWIGWFPFTLFDTDWMGREIYRGDPNGGQNYHIGVRMGAFGLMMNSIVLGFTAIMLEKICRKVGSGFVWGISGILLSFCLGAMLIITAVVKNMDFSGKGLPPTGVVVAALFAFTILGVPLSITYSLPYALISARTEALGLGQGLSMGILNLAIVIPQIQSTFSVPKLRAATSLLSFEGGIGFLEDLERVKKKIEKLKNMQNDAGSSNVGAAMSPEAPHF